MKFALKSLVAASAFVMAGVAAAAPLTLSAGGSVTDQGWTVSELTGSGTLSFSSTLIGALNAGGIAIEQISPAAVTTVLNKKNKYVSASAAAPIQSISGTFDGSTVTVTGVSTLGGAKQISEFDDFAIKASGGFLEIKNLRVDLTVMKVYADLVGANGVGTHNNTEMWSISNIVGSTSFAAVEGVTTSVNELTGLTINANAFSLFAQALALTDNVGVPSLQTVTDFGKITSTISVRATRVATPAVPEPSTYALMGAGLAAIAVLSRRKQRR